MKTPQSSTVHLTCDSPYLPYFPSLPLTLLEPKGNAPPQSHPYPAPSPEPVDLDLPGASTMGSKRPSAISQQQVQSSAKGPVGRFRFGDNSQRNRCCLAFLVHPNRDRILICCFLKRGEDKFEGSSYVRAKTQISYVYMKFMIIYAWFLPWPSHLLGRRAPVVQLPSQRAKSRLTNTWLRLVESCLSESQMEVLTNSFICKGESITNPIKIQILPFVIWAQ